MTTVGYGDFIPISTWGYVVGSMCAITGIFLLALTIPTVSSNFTLYYTHTRATDTASSMQKSNVLNNTSSIRSLSRSFSHIGPREAFVIAPSSPEESPGTATAPTGTNPRWTGIKKFFSKMNPRNRPSSPSPAAGGAVPAGAPAAQGATPLAGNIKGDNKTTNNATNHSGGFLDCRGFQAPWFTPSDVIPLDQTAQSDLLSHRHGDSVTSSLTHTIRMNAVVPCAPCDEGDLSESDETEI